MGQYFGTDGIRGHVGALITPEFAYALGRAMHVLEGHLVVIGWDTRESSEPLAYALAKGLKEVGKDVLFAGVLPTPGIAYYSGQHNLLAVMITASHNPYTDNGFKIFKNGIKLLKDVEAQVESALVSGKVPPIEQPGKEVDVQPTPFDEYTAFLESHAPITLPFKFGCDFGNGATYKAGNFLFSKLYPRHFQGFSYYPNGTNINEGVGALHPHVLAQRLKDHGLDYGFSFDGDGDRIIMTDASGRIYDGDDMLYLIALDLQSKGQLTGNKVALTVMSNLGIIKALEKRGIEAAVTDVGDANVLAACLKDHIEIGAEASGHVMIPRLLKGGDGLLVATQLMHYLSTQQQSAATILNEVNRYAEVLINVRTTKKEVVKHERVLATIDRIKNELNGDGKVFARASGTEPLVRITVSAPTHEQVDRYSSEIKNLIESLINV